MWSKRGTKTLPPFNNKDALRVLQLPCGSLGILDNTTWRVWKEREMQSVYMAQWRQFPQLSLPDFPVAYGTWQAKSIGGVSATFRRLGVLRCVDGATDPVTLFAIDLPSPLESDHFPEALGVTVGEMQHEEHFGMFCEVLVAHPEDVSCVAARIAVLGGTPVFEEETLNAERVLATERLDRIGADVVTSDAMVDVDDHIHGLRRGYQNWHFAWLPEGWEPPITWDHMSRNVASTRDVGDLPLLLRQHVAKMRIDAGEYPPIGSAWSPAPPAVPDEVAFHQATPDAIPPYPLRRIIELSDDDVEHLAFDAVARRFDETMCHFVGILPHVIAFVDGVWYAPKDTQAELRQHVPSRRLVTAALAPAQSKQLITAFFYLSVVGCDTYAPETARAFSLVLFRYMMESGYTARWLGKYKQDAMHVGNGERRRSFLRMPQYQLDKLPTSILNRICTVQGTTEHKRSKGSRSKYKKKNRVPYKPTRRMTRTQEDERRMVSHHSAGL